jgi:glyoxylase I family protein
MRIKGVHHAAIICSNYERSKHFYVELLGLKVLHETYRSERDSYKLDLLLGEREQIELFSFPNPPVRVNQPEAQGLRHLAFSVENMEEAVQGLKGRGIEVEPVRLDPITGNKYTFFADPDGLRLELVEVWAESGKFLFKRRSRKRSWALPKAVYGVFSFPFYFGLYCLDGYGTVKNSPKEYKPEAG